MHTKPVLVATLCLAFALSAKAQDVSGGRWIDLTHPFNAETIYWPTAKTFEKETVFAGHTDGGYYFIPLKIDYPSAEDQIVRGFPLMVHWNGFARVSLK